MASNAKVNVLLVDDQPAKLLAFEVILQELGENLIKASSAREALDHLLRMDVAVVLVDVCMPELDGFQLASMIREHPRFQKTAIIFISAIHLTDVDRLRGYEMGAVDYVPVPVVPEVLRAKVRVFAELYRKTRELEQLNSELERRVAERTADLEASTLRLLQSEQLRSLALAAGQMGSWDWDIVSGKCVWDEGQYRIFGVDPHSYAVTLDNLRTLIHPADWERLQAAFEKAAEVRAFQTEFRVRRPNGELRWCLGAGAANVYGVNHVVRVSGVTVDITDLKVAEERRTLLVKEVDHRARNALAVVQSIVRLTKAKSIDEYISAIEGRIGALSTAHVLLSESRWEGADLSRLLDEELAPYRSSDAERITVVGPAVFLQPAVAQILALVLHELATNAAKYGALSMTSGRVMLTWQIRSNELVLEWEETGGPTVEAPVSKGYGTKVISASVERQLGGRAIFDWHPEGLHFNLSVPCGEKMKLSESGFRGRSTTEKDKGAALAKAMAGNRILLVEDEALVGMMTSDMLTDLGFHVIGPFGRVADAFAAAGREDFHAAVLDVNVGGGLVYPVAELIAARGVPLIFLTGYGAEGIDGRFAHVPLLQKPIEKHMLQNMLVVAGNGSGEHHGSSAPCKDAPSAVPIETLAENRLGYGANAIESFSGNGPRLA
jgi:two-component sensor histidine kinase/DNA-binding response OmpR family regulator